MPELSSAPKSAPAPAHRYSPEQRKQAVRQVHELHGPYMRKSEAIGRVAARIGCHPNTLTCWVRTAERHLRPATGPRPEQDQNRRRIAQLEQQVRELRRTNALLRRLVESTGGIPSGDR